MAHYDCSYCGAGMSDDCCDENRRDHAKYVIKQWASEVARRMMEEDNIINEYIEKAIKTKEFYIPYRYKNDFRNEKDKELYNQELTRMRYKLMGKKDA